MPILGGLGHVAQASGQTIQSKTSPKRLRVSHLGGLRLVASASLLRVSGVLFGF